MRWLSRAVILACNLIVEDNEVTASLMTRVSRVSFTKYCSRLQAAPRHLSPSGIGPLEEGHFKRGRRTILGEASEIKCHLGV